jgi:flagellar hook-basal body complex protein FliE
MIPAMNTVSAAAVGSPAGVVPGADAIAGGSESATPFSDLISDAVGQVDQLESSAQQAVAGLMAGNGVDVHQAVIATEKASMVFELALAVRNKAVQAYQSVMGMQF